MSTCFFIGHRDAPDSILPSLSAAIETRIVEDGVDQFVVGNYGRFDLLAAQAVRKAKKQHLDILLFYLRPYHPAVGPLLLPASMAPFIRQGWRASHGSWQSSGPTDP